MICTPIAERLRRLSSPAPSGCIEWTGFTLNGYGRIRVADRTLMAHRVSYETHVRALTPGEYIDHLCRNRGCINVEHLEPVTFKENILRGDGPTARNARKTHCPAGHQLIAGNLKREKAGGRGRCRACHNARNVKYQQAKRKKLREI